MIQDTTPPPRYGPGDYRPGWREVGSPRQFLTDWALVQPGRVDWHEGPSGPRPVDVPSGERLVVQPAQKSEPSRHRAHLTRSAAGDGDD